MSCRANHHDWKFGVQNRDFVEVGFWGSGLELGFVSGWDSGFVILMLGFLFRDFEFGF